MVNYICWQKPTLTLTKRYVNFQHIFEYKFERLKEVQGVQRILCFLLKISRFILDSGTVSVCTEVGIYERKQESKKTRKHALDQEKEKTFFFS